MMLTRRMGYVQLAEPVRFVHEWERDASLRLRSGDASVLATYEEQGRLRGGEAEQVMELAARAWLADHLCGKDALLIARTTGQARELSRRVRGELIHYGLVQAGGEVRLRDGAEASAGDLIVARRNDRRVTAGKHGRWLANHDILRIESTTVRAVSVRRLTGRDEAGQPVWSWPFELPKTYLSSHCDLAYATTAHAAQGRTVDAAHVLVDGLGDRQGLYVGMSRGREANYAYCVTGFPRAADVREGSQPAAELERVRVLTAERAGLRPQPAAADAEDESVPCRDPVSVLAETLQRDGAVLSATEILHNELSNADHLGVLGSIWYDLARRAQTTRYEQALRQVLPTGDAQAALSDTACVWLWRSLREAEAAGLDGAKVLRLAVASRPLDGARDPARVIDSRVRRMTGHTLPKTRATWAERVPAMGDPDLDRYMAELAAAMDDRVHRIGEHATATQPLWATQALGDLPADPAKRAEWQARAATIGAYRELYGYDTPADPIGPEPAKTSPEARADWHTAFAALGKVDGIDLRGLTDDQLWLRRAGYERETAWAPRHVGEELRLARQQARTAWENAIREDHELRAATDSGAAGRHQTLAAMWRAMETKATKVAGMLAEAQETRRQWEALTEPTRRVAVAADLELRRRYPDRVIAPLRSAEPTGGLVGESTPTPAPRRSEVWVQGTLDRTAHLAVGEQAPTEATQRVLVPQVEREVQGQQALGLTPDTVHEDIPGQVQRIRETARQIQAKVDDFASTREPAEEPDATDLGPAWNVQATRQRDAILQPPKPDVVPASKVLERSHDHQADLEPELE